MDSVPRTGGDKTKAKILRMAEKLFSENGFAGTGIEKIARAAGVNKATLYYHFKDKNDIIHTLLETMIKDIDTTLHQVVTDNTSMGIREKLNFELKSYLDRKNIIAVMLMESLKNDTTTDYLFKFAAKIVQYHYGASQNRELSEIDYTCDNFKKYMVNEFFTGIGPSLLFITLKDKYRNYFSVSEEQLNEYFIEAFIKNHLTNHNSLKL